MDGRAAHETFHWSECEQRLTELARGRQFLLEPEGRYFEADDERIWPPLVFPIPGVLQDAARGADTAMEAAARRKAGAACADLESYLAQLPAQPGLQCLILMQAGATSIGMFDAGEVLATKTLKRYVVRGKGRAQPAYLSTKGKSRYGSRLRLQNARLLLEETNAKLRAYWDEYGTPECIFAAAPARLWPDLFRCPIAPPFAPEHPILRVPLDVPVPTTDVMLRTYKSLCYGRVESDAS